jgi:hypothetical protein
MTQNQWILDSLKRGPLTPIDALNGCGCFRLAARIKDLREAGHPIETKNKNMPNGKTVAEYHLKEKTNGISQ